MPFPVLFYLDKGFVLAVSLKESGGPTHKLSINVIWRTASQTPRILIIRIRLLFSHRVVVRGDEA